ncbi:MAG: hypothetical protein QMD10_13085, partial [Desulfitobacteriaceae bacterium]|nr:hypothetical protein [Desulfitobacteriaceae bacterium]
WKYENPYKPFRKYITYPNGRGEKLFRKYRVKIQFSDRILGGVPKAKELIQGWLRARGVKAEDVKELAEKVEEEVEAVPKEELEMAAWTGFKRDDEGLYIEERQVKACLREAASTLALTKIRGFRDAVNHGVFTQPDKIHLKRKGQLIKEPDGYEEGPIHVMGPRGPRTALKRQDYIEEAEAEFTLLVAGSTIAEKDLQQMMELGQYIGLGASRSQGYGKFTLVEFKPVQ